ncbi:MAG: hypothetical protein K8S62_08770 [Candidatus Sabulitectum sp.]|nr:hypothetical protein [Candidatus Sabulitectum sp.]
MPSDFDFEFFKHFDLNAYEAKSYLALLNKDCMSAVEVSKIARIPRARIYETLENLMIKGLCCSIAGKVSKYSCVSPTVLNEKLNSKIADANEEIEQRKLELSSFENTAREFISSLVPYYEESRTNRSKIEYIEIIKNPFQIHKRYMQLIEQAEEEILVFTKPPFTGPPKKLDEQIDQQIDVLKKKIHSRGIFEIAADKEGRILQLQRIRNLVKAGDEIRVLEEVPMKLAIFDTKTILSILVDPISKQASFNAQIIEHEALAKTLKIAFDAMWQQAQDYHVLENQGGVTH